MKVKVFTILPEIFPGFLGVSLIGKALAEGKWSLNTVNIRDYAFDRYGSVDDTPSGGGAGMIMRADVLGEALAKNYNKGVLLNMSPRGIPFSQQMAHQLAQEDELNIICSRFEGVDERVLEEYKAIDVSLGDYVLTGGEQAAMIMLDAIIRLLPDVLGNSASIQDESFEGGLLEYPQYTRPTEWKGHKIPEVLLSGHHQKINDWRKAQSEIITEQRRPDLWKKYLELK